MGETNVYQRVYDVVRLVPAGRVVTYGQVAAASGSPRGARTVGWAMRHCPEDVPWHRVVDRAGRLRCGTTDAALLLQRALLESDGVVVSQALTVDLARYAWDGV
jgi:methylated-DNA-protein-cysteine methyltransferase related protein